MSKRPSFKAFKEQALKDPKLKKEYDLLEDEYQLIDELIAKRIAANMSQQKLAEKLGTKQPAIARLESGAMANATLTTLRNYADAVGCYLRIQLINNKVKRG